MKIMFICTGNICRSAMADWLLKKKVEENQMKNVEVYSSGVFAETGSRSTYNAIEAMKEYEVDLRQHKATNTKDSPIKDMDLILCMTQSHKITLLQMYPERKDKIVTLKEYVKEEKEDIDIADPWGYDITTYRFCANEINDCLELLLDKILKNGFTNKI